MTKTGIGIREETQYLYVDMTSTIIQECGICAKFCLVMKKNKIIRIMEKNSERVVRNSAAVKSLIVTRLNLPRSESTKTHMKTSAVSEIYFMSTIFSESMYLQCNWLYFFVYEWHFPKFHHIFSNEIKFNKPCKSSKKIFQFVDRYFFLIIRMWKLTEI